MLVQRVLTFIKELKCYGKLTPYDLILITMLEDCFTHGNEQVVLTASDIRFITECYRARWPEVADSDAYDYTLNPIGITQKWIEFAQEFALFANSTAMNLLIPVITNSRDYNNLSLLTETTRLENLYLGHDNKTLYRKRGLCEHLIATHFNLSTCRELQTKRLSPMTVVELSRLRMCKQPNGGFSIDSEEFVSFWDFLDKKVFPHLQDKGQLPRGLLGSLSSLVDDYYTLKSKGAAFKFFKQAVAQFINSLYNIDLDTINFFYGIKIQHNKVESYLLEYLITLHTAKAYNIDEQLIGLRRYFIKFDKGLNKASKAVPLLHLDVLPKAIREPADMGIQSPALERCGSLIVSLFSTRFEFYSFMGTKISFWDQSNMVFPDASKIYSQFIPAIEANNPAEMNTIYSKVINEIVRPAQKECGFFAKATRFKTTDMWFALVDSGKLAHLGINWFRPALILDALLNANFGNHSINYKATVLLDELIHTYAQDNNELFKMIRVNILFANFMMELPPNTHQKTLLDLLRARDVERAEIIFKTNCMIYISRRLALIGRIRTVNAFVFFDCIMNETKLNVPQSIKEISRFGIILNWFETKLNEPKLPLTDKIRAKMLAYLSELKRPILSIAEVQFASNNAQSLDYLNAPS
ncbi:MAG: hypothetical protein ACHP65_03425 [Legionellales bacterium]